MSARINAASATRAVIVTLPCALALAYGGCSLALAYPSAAARELSCTDEVDDDLVAWPANPT